MASRSRPRMWAILVSVTVGSIAAVVQRPASAQTAQDLVRDSVPMKWIEPFRPEDLPKLEHPAYYNELDKARAESFTGRYKQSLMTLARLERSPAAREITPEHRVEVTLIKARSLAVRGRW